MFTVALFTECSQNMWKRSKHSSTAEWISQFWDIYMEHYTAIKRNKVLIICHNMDEP